MNTFTVDTVPSYLIAGFRGLRRGMTDMLVLTKISP